MTHQLACEGRLLAIDVGSGCCAARGKGLFEDNGKILRVPLRLGPGQEVRA